jgi:hypothetical protein
MSLRMCGHSKSISIQIQTKKSPNLVTINYPICSLIYIVV